MTKIENCIKEIQKIREVYAGVAPAYAGRSRIARLIVNTSLLIAESAGIDKLEMPRRLILPKDANPVVMEISIICNKILDISKTITMPSEPLDKRWESGWTEIIEYLNLLEIQLSNWNKSVESEKVPSAF